MKFVDEISIKVKSGNGGSGSVSFLHTHLNPFSGPDGGEGGKGGDVLFKGSSQINSFYKFTFNRKWVAQSGSDGGKGLKKGKDGENLYIEVPLGTIIYLVDENKKKNLFFEIVDENQVVIASKGGKGGLGNSSFKTSTNRTPRYKQKGFVTEEIEFFLELRIIADVGLVGLPNSGKSTILNCLTNSNSKVGDFEFTTINPQLGVIDYKKGRNLIIADLPGIIEGSLDNKGLGFKFLKHVSRCKIITYVLNADRKKIFEDFKFLKSQLFFSPFKKKDFQEFNSLLVINKIDTLIDEEIKILVDELKIFSKIEKIDYVLISALIGTNLEILINYFEKFSKQKTQKNTKSLMIFNNPFYVSYDFTNKKPELHVKELKKNFWKIYGFYIENFVSENKNKSSFGELLSKLFENDFVKELLTKEGVKIGDTLLIDNEEYLWT